ncbi:MAG: malonyl CoA-acyl carrier protein transacylase, partial [Myxococcota bacterium]|nr:malonyl CoA-acyl carrier protein transacylase [Myxococcota bacterium]
GLLKSQVTAPVRFVESVDYLVSQGVTHFLEVGPGGVLSGLVARIQRRSKRSNFASMDGLDESREFLINA